MRLGSGRAAERRSGGRRSGGAEGVLRLAGLLGLCVLAAAGCGGGDQAAAAVTREVVGDTTIVRSGGAGAWGVVSPTVELRIGALDGAEEYTFGRVDGVVVDDAGTIYVLDSQALEVRVFDAEGNFVRRFGRSGSGPGELKQPSGMVWLADGRLLVRDPGNSRMNIYTPAGESSASWPIPGGFFTSAPVLADDSGNVYTDIIAVRNEDGTWQTGLLRLGPDGAVVDTLVRPFAEYRPPALTAQRVSGQSRSMTTSAVPFWPQAHFTLNRQGQFVGGIGDRYAVHTWRPDGTVLRLERSVAPVPVDPDEASTAVERITRNMRRLDSNWKWDGPRPPQTKPAFRDIRVADDGRIWLRTSQPAERVPPDPDARRDPAAPAPLDRWVEPLVYDVFESDGTFLGTVALPDKFRPSFMRGDHIWGVATDEYDVNYVVRLGIG